MERHDEDPTHLLYQANRQLRKAQGKLNWIAKRIPGLGPIDDLERIAIFGDGCLDPADIKALQDLATRLRELRAGVRGEGRRERDQRLTREAMAQAAEADRAPFEEVVAPPSDG